MQQDASAPFPLPSEAWQRKRVIQPTGVENGLLQVRAARPDDELSLAQLHLQTGLPILAEAAEEGEILFALGSGTEADPDPLAELSAEEMAADQQGDMLQVRRHSQSGPVVQLAEDIVGKALRDGITDIHLEPSEDHLKVRFRKDGMLRLHRDLPSWVQPALVSRFKILAGMDIAERRLPQDGAIRYEWRGVEVDIRASILPTRFGEKLVLRLLRKTTQLRTLEGLGLPASMLERLRFFLTRPQGMIFITGPTGSGKSSTLYAGLQQILGGEINITTIEDPVEYDLPGANQVQINEKAGLTFASALRSILRQDPDVILVGEIRDGETARIAAQAAQTGHLVLSTLHTNDSIAAITRLRDLGVEPYLIGNSVLCFMAQRLVRKVCPHCSRTAAPTPEVIARIPGLPAQVPVAVGCSKCQQTGYLGRVAVFEMIPIAGEIRDLVLSGAPESDVRRLARQGTLVQDGIRRICEGVTTPEELLRVVVVE